MSFLIKKYQKIAFGCTCFFGISGLLAQGWLHAQESMIEVINLSLPSLVTVTAEATGVFKSPQASAALDKNTGRVVVLRNVKASSYKRTGAGVILNTDGIIVTNLHIIMNCNQVKVQLHNSNEFPAKIVKIFPSSDLAFLKISVPFPLKPIFIANSDQVELRDEVYTVGNSSLLKETLSGGKVIGLGTHREGQNSNGAAPDLIQINMNLYPGDSGGPLLNKRGQLIGLMVAGQRKKDRSSFAISSNQIIKYFNDYINESRTK